MISPKLLALFFIVALLGLAHGRRLHFESEPAIPTESGDTTVDASAKQASNDTTASTNATETNTTETNTTETNTTDTNATATAQPATQTTDEPNKQTKEGSGSEGGQTQQPLVLNSTSTETATQTNTTTTEGDGAATGEVANDTAPTSTGESNGDTVPISDLPTMTTQQLTLNLSNLKFPDPKPQGDTLNLSGISITTSTSSSKTSSGKCKAGYTVSSEGNNCQLADILLQTNLDAENLILGDLNLEELKQKQAEFRKQNEGFTVIECSGETPYLSKQGCIACNAPNNLFSLKSLKCSRCPEGATYNSESRNCESGGAAAGGQFVSNTNASNYLVLPGQSLDDYKKEIEETQKSNPNVQVCPEDKPYSTGSECVSCPASKPLFFIASKSCTACQANSTYSPDIHSCLGKKYRITTITRTSNKQQGSSGSSGSSKEKDNSSSSSDDKKNKNDDSKSESKQEKEGDSKQDNNKENEKKNDE